MDAPLRPRRAAAGPRHFRWGLLILALGISLLSLQQASQESMATLSSSSTSRTPITITAVATITTSGGGEGEGMTGIEKEKEAAKLEAKKKQREATKEWSWQKAREGRKWQGNEGAGIGATKVGASAASAQGAKWMAIAEQQLEERRRRGGEEIKSERSLGVEESSGGDGDDVKGKEVIESMVEEEKREDDRSEAIEFLFSTGTKEEVAVECAQFKKNAKALAVKEASDILKFASQVRQDGWLYQTMFHIFEKAGVTGTYIDLASAYPRFGSNTFFFDMCLGWKGLCIEGDPAKASRFRDSIRTCIFEEMCIAKETGIKRFISGVENGGSTVVTDSEKTSSSKGTIIEINCGPLAPLLEEHKLHHVDFMSLDIEGFEFEALSTVDLSKIEIDIFVVESAPYGSQVHKFLVQKHGYSPMGLIALTGSTSAIDYVFVRPGSIWLKYCEWERGPRDLSEFKKQRQKNGKDNIQHAWPRKCDFDAIEQELKNRKQ